MSGLGERGTRLRAVAKKVEPPPVVPPFYVESPDGDLRALGWYMRMERKGPAIYLGHSAAVAEVYLLQLAAEKPRRKVAKSSKKRATA